ncbi:MAG: phosphate ABC transporter [Betaproteobacteria bacterium HGW-Betaproteobacteria-7]|jgi:phosphate transport system substrate-binding protein|nr:MAG: phosphate ABC transporter [Betaproteobacteria bacterium HGW-Betaproteobacteria-7]
MAGLVHPHTARQHPLLASLRRLHRLLLLTATLLPAAPASALDIVGASTIQPVIEQLQPLIEGATGEPLRVRGGGSAAGAAAVMDGHADIGMVSRALHADEQALLQHELIGHDALAIVANRANPLPGLSKAQLLDIYGGRLSNWQLLAGSDRPIVLVSKEVGRSTLELFEEYSGLRSPGRPPGDAAPRISSRAHIIGANLEALTLVGGLPGAIGYVSVGTARSLAAVGMPVKILTLDGKEPNERNIADGSYPIIRELNLVFRQRTPQVERLLALLRSAEGSAALRRNGFQPVPGRAGSAP